MRSVPIFFFQFATETEGIRCQSQPIHFISRRRGRGVFALICIIQLDGGQQRHGNSAGPKVELFPADGTPLGLILSHITLPVERRRSDYFKLQLKSPPPKFEYSKMAPVGSLIYRLYWPHIGQDGSCVNPNDAPNK